MRQEAQENRELVVAYKSQLGALREVLAVEERQGAEWKRAAFQAQEEVEELAARVGAGEEERGRLQGRLREAQEAQERMVREAAGEGGGGESEAAVRLAAQLKEAEEQITSLRHTNYLFQEDRQKLREELAEASQELEDARIEIRDLMQVNALLTERLATCIHDETAHHSATQTSSSTCSSTCSSTLSTSDQQPTCPSDSSSSISSIPAGEKVKQQVPLPAATVARLGKEQQLRELLGVGAEEAFVVARTSCKRQTGPKEWSSGHLHVTQRHLCWVPRKAKQEGAVTAALLHLAAVDLVGKTSLLGGQLDVVYAADDGQQKEHRVCMYLRKREQVAAAVCDAAAQLGHQVQLRRDGVVQATEFMGFVVLDATAEGLSPHPSSSTTSSINLI